MPDQQDAQTRQTQNPEQDALAYSLSDPCATPSSPLQETAARQRHRQPGIAPDDTSTAQAVHALYTNYASDVYRYARLLLHDAVLADDVVQEVFLRALKNWHKFRHDANPKTWLLSISRNYIYDLMRKQRRERRTAMTPTDASSNETDAVVNTVAIEQALAQLKPSYRQAIVLRHIEELSMQQTAEVLGWSLTQVRTTTHRAMTKLRKVFRESNEAGAQTITEQGGGESDARR